MSALRLTVDGRSNFLFLCFLMCDWLVQISMDILLLDAIFCCRIVNCSLGLQDILLHDATNFSYSLAAVLGSLVYPRALGKALLSTLSLRNRTLWVMVKMFDSVCIISVIASTVFLHPATLFLLSVRQLSFVLGKLYSFRVINQSALSLLTNHDLSLSRIYSSSM